MAHDLVAQDMVAHYEDTIFAVASGIGRSAIAIVRLSGPNAGSTLVALTNRPLPPPRMARLCALLDPASGEQLDQALILWFPAPASFTGEDVVEFQIHGGRAVINDLCTTLLKQTGVRLAEPGEFTRRAFERGKLDLTEAEAIADLIEADTSHQRRQALKQRDGHLGKLYDEWRSALVLIMAQLETYIDFPEEDLPETLYQNILHSIETLQSNIRPHLNDNNRGQRLRDGLSVVILGPPNAGKSSILNYISKQDLAIVSPQSGTTRDIIEVNLDISGYPIILSDTAGIRVCSDLVEAEGVKRAIRRAESAEVKIVVFDGLLWPETDPACLDLIDDNTILLLNKFDLHNIERPVIATRPALAVSAATGHGLAELTALLADRAERLLGGEALCLTRQRHRIALERACVALESASQEQLPELMAEELRAAAYALGTLTGRISVDEVLDTVFRQFCLGK